jgi:hypothetical protein
MHKLAFLAVLAACGGGGSAHTDAADDPDSAPGTDGQTPMDDAAVDAPPPFAGSAPARLIVSGAKRLHGPGTLVVDVEIGHALDQRARTSGSIVVRGGAAVFGN